MNTGTLISPSHGSSLPPRPLFAAFCPSGVVGLLRRVAGRGFPLLLSGLRPSVMLSFFAFHRRGAPAIARVPRGSYPAARNRPRPGQRRVSLSRTQAPILRIVAASHWPTVCAMLLPIMLMPSPAPNTAVKAAPFGRWTLRDKAPRSAPYLRR